MARSFFAGTTDAKEQRDVKRTDVGLDILEHLKEKPAPQGAVERARLVRPDAAIVQARKYWPNVITLDDGTRIPSAQRD